MCGGLPDARLAAKWVVSSCKSSLCSGSLQWLCRRNYSKHWWFTCVWKGNTWFGKFSTCTNGPIFFAQDIRMFSQDFHTHLHEEYDSKEKCWDAVLAFSCLLRQHEKSDTECQNEPWGYWFSTWRETGHTIYCLRGILTFYRLTVTKKKPMLHRPPVHRR